MVLQRLEATGVREVGVEHRERGVTRYERGERFGEGVARRDAVRRERGERPADGAARYGTVVLAPFALHLGVAGELELFLDNLRVQLVVGDAAVPALALALGREVAAAARLDGLGQHEAGRRAARLPGREDLLGRVAVDALDLQTKALGDPPEVGDALDGVDTQLRLKAVAVDIDRDLA